MGSYWVISWKLAWGFGENLAGCGLVGRGRRSKVVHEERWREFVKGCEKDTRRIFSRRWSVEGGCD